MTSRYLHLAVAIQRRHPRERWREELAKLPAEAQEECRRYLRGMYYRAEVARIAKGNAQCPTDPEPYPRVPSGT